MFYIFSLTTNSMIMKQLFLLILIVTSLNTYSQDTIYLKNGTKIIPEAGGHKFYGTPKTRIGSDNKSLAYDLPNSRWTKSVKYKDLDYAVVGDKLIKTFELKYRDKTERSKPLAHYVLIETEQYRLISVVYSNGLIVPVVHVFIIDKDDAIVESANYVAGNTKNDKKEKEATIAMIKKYFSHIKEEMDFLDYCKSTDKYDETGLASFLNTHPYKKYN